jgi:hypothetical protein
MMEGMTTINAAQVQPGDVVLVQTGDENFPAGVYQAPLDEASTWSAMQPMGAYGDIPQPEGDLVLLARNGSPVPW